MSRSVWSAAYPAAFRRPARNARITDSSATAKAAGYAHSKRFALFGCVLAGLRYIAELHSAGEENAWRLTPLTPSEIMDAEQTTFVPPCSLRLPTGSRSEGAKTFLVIFVRIFRRDKFPFAEMDLLAGKNDELRAL